MNTQETPALADQYVIAYADGSCCPNPGQGGHAWTAQTPDGQSVEYLQHDPETNNAIQEMLALLSFLQWVSPEQKAVVHLDSQFVVRGCNEWLSGWEAKGWRGSGGKAVKNAELWQQISTLLKNCQVRVEWVKGHSGSTMNDRADTLAKKAAGDWGLVGGVLYIDGEIQ